MMSLFFSTFSLLFVYQRCVQTMCLEEANTLRRLYLIPNITKKKKKLNFQLYFVKFSQSTHTDFRETGEENPYSDEEGRLDAWKLDADDVVLGFLWMLVALRENGGGVVAGRTRSRLLRVLSGLTGVVAGRREAAQSGIVRQNRADDRAHGPEAQAGISAVEVAGKITGVGLRPVRRGVLLRRDLLRGAIIVEACETSGVTVFRAARQDDDDDDEEEEDHRGETAHGATGATRRRRRRRCFCRGRSAPSSALVRRR